MRTVEFDAITDHWLRQVSALAASLLILAASDTAKSQSTLQIVENPASGLSDLQ